MVAANILGQPREADYSAIPRCVFTTPSVYAVGEPARPELTTARVSLGEVARGRLGPDDLGCLELYAADGVLAGAVAVGPDAATWMAEVTLAIRAKIPVTILADVVHAFPTYGEALQAAFRELARTDHEEDRAVERIGHGDARGRRHRAASGSRRGRGRDRWHRSRSTWTRRTQPSRRARSASTTTTTVRMS